MKSESIQPSKYGPAEVSARERAIQAAFEWLGMGLGLFVLIIVGAALGAILLVLGLVCALAYVTWLLARGIVKAIRPRPHPRLN
jgi:hypothetical protein